MLSLAATWTTVVIFLPTLLLERGITVALGGPVLACCTMDLFPVPHSPGAAAQASLVGASAVQYVLGIAIVLTLSPWLRMGLLTGMGVVWIVSPAIEVLPFEFPGIRPRQVAVLASLVKTLAGLGFAIGPVVTGVVTQYTGSLQTGCLTLCGLTSVGIIAGLLYPRARQSAGAAEVIQS
jgi:hypothetical protein